MFEKPAEVSASIVIMHNRDVFERYLQRIWGYQLCVG